MTPNDLNKEKFRFPGKFYILPLFKYFLGFNVNELTPNASNTKVGFSSFSTVFLNFPALNDLVLRFGFSRKFHINSIL